ncbi:hypothetical protein B0H11DRAFT_1703638 [Mycena galericulata]|nr:hypothetical protein B0H11DRAFT_1703638 [Mycena galericulata]
MYASEKRTKRAKESLKSTRASLKTISTWCPTKKGMYSRQCRNLALAFTKAGCAQSKIGHLMALTGKTFGIHVRRKIGRRTVGRVITEAGIKARIQNAAEFARAPAIVLSSDGTSHRNIKYHARHATLQVPTYTNDPTAPQTAFKTRVIEIKHAIEDTADAQFGAWDVINHHIVQAYSNSPLGRRDALSGVRYEEKDLWRKLMSYHGDHAADVKCVARKCKDRKREVVQGDLGQCGIEEMTEDDVEEALWCVIDELCEEAEKDLPSYGLSCFFLFSMLIYPFAFQFNL